jgi:hypothetical protein
MIKKHIYRTSQKKWRLSRTIQGNNNEKLYLQITDTLNRISQNIDQTPHGYIRRSKRWQHTMIFEQSVPKSYSILLKARNISNYQT